MKKKTNHYSSTGAILDQDYGNLDYDNLTNSHSIMSYFKELPEGDVQLEVKHYDIPPDLYNRLSQLGIINSPERINNEGDSNYSTHLIQPWSIWLDWNLNAWDADIIKRVLRTKGKDGEEEFNNRILDYKKIIHICQERIRQLNGGLS